MKNGDGAEANVYVASLQSAGGGASPAQGVFGLGGAAATRCGQRVV